MDSRSEIIAKIRARAAKATPGPWGWFGNAETNAVYLATEHSGREYIVVPRVRAEQAVFDHENVESYTLHEAKEGQRVIAWCGAHLEGSDPDTRELLCRCDEIRDFLSGEITPEEGARHLTARDQVSHQLSRTVSANPDLLVRTRTARSGERYPVMKSYREVARYEVLGGKTMDEHVANGGRESDLYRADIVGIASPEADFIAHSREDVAVLLGEIDRLNAALRSLGAEGT